MITWKIVETTVVGKRKPKSYKKCDDCGCDLTHYRFEFFKWERVPCLDIPRYAFVNPSPKIRVCPACVLLEYVNKDTFWNKLVMWFKPRYRRYQLEEIIREPEEKKVLVYEPPVLDRDPEIFGPIKYE
jgi:hypothetical protein